jgi:hypothetical protein
LLRFARNDSISACHCEERSDEAISLSVSLPPPLGTLVRPSRASIPYLDRYSPDRPLVLECSRPQGHNPDQPVVIVQHGMSRNGAEYGEA